MNVKADRTLSRTAICSAVGIVLLQPEGADSLPLSPHRIPEAFRGDRLFNPDLAAADEMRGLERKADQADRSEPYQESSPMRCPKCEADKWYEVATHDPWSGRPVIACKICGEYAELEALKREDAHDVIARTLADDLVGEGQADARPIASKILQALENAGLTISGS
ncbi:hypothetical protein RAD15_24670 [Bradyrhizobium sp. 14AA]